MVCSGLSDVSGSWKMMVMSSPRISRIWRSLSPIRSRPLKKMRPVGWLAAGYGRSFMTDSAVTDLPEPDSPTSASVSPFFTLNEMRSTASVSRLPWRNMMDRSLTASSGSAVMSMRSPEGLSRVEGVTHRLADVDQERQHDRDREEAGKTEPRRLDVGLALRQELAKRR